MKFRSIFQWAGLFSVLFCLQAAAFGQSFQVIGRTLGGSGFLELDKTLSVTLQVQGTGVTSPVVPELVPGSAVASSVSVTWSGTEPISNWSGTRSLTFFIHLYNVPSECGQGDIPFQLFFDSPNFSTPIQASAGSDLLDFSTVTNNQVSLDFIASDLLGTPVWPIPTGFVNNPLFRHDLPAGSNTDPDVRVYLYMDYYLNGFTFDNTFQTALYNINAQCVMELNSDIFDTPEQFQVDGLVIDNTVTPSQILTQAPIGGGGPFPQHIGDGVNVFDITNLNLALCSGTPKQLLNTDNGLYGFDYIYFGIEAIVRDAKIFLGSQVGCTVGDTVFGGVPAAGTFQIEDMFLSSAGDIRAELVVPDGTDGWLDNSGTQLRDTLRVEWYLRRDDDIVDLGIETRSLILNEKVSMEIDDPSGYFLEARVKTTSGNHWVSTNNSGFNHALSYQVLSSVQFTNAEQDPNNGLSSPDDFFDPGEIITLPYRLSGSSSVLSGVDTITGFLVDDGDGVIDAGDREVFANQVADNDINIRILPVNRGSGTSSRTDGLPFQLVSAPNNSAVWFIAETEIDHAAQGTTSTYRRYIDLTDIFGVSDAINLEDTLLSQEYDFVLDDHEEAGWSVDNMSQNVGWSWSANNGWVGDALGQQQAADVYFTLVSPPIPVGRSASVELAHRPNFTFNQSGGLMEFRVEDENGTPETGWVNFISLACSLCNNAPSCAATCDIYDSIAFPDNIDSYLKNADVWMGMDTSYRIESINVPDSFASLYDPTDRIRFRLLFQFPEWVAPRGGATRWEVDRFSIESRVFLEDNALGFESFEISTCDDSMLQVSANSPINNNPNLLQVTWYPTLADVYNGTNGVSNSGLTVPFPISTTPGNYLFYAHVTYGVTQRIIPVTVVRPTECFGCLTLEQVLSDIRNEVEFGWPAGRTVIDLIRIFRNLCE